MSDQEPPSRLWLQLQTLWLDGWIKGLGFLIGLAVLAIIWAVNLDPEKRIRDGYEVADVLNVFDLTSETKRVFAVQVRLQNGDEYVLKAKSLVPYGGVKQQVCIARYRGESGTMSYKITSPSFCRDEGATE